MKSRHPNEIPSPRERQGVRPCAVCGMFYPSDRHEVQKEIASYLDAVDVNRHFGMVDGLIVPHAGYRYSGLTAAHAYAQIRGREFKTVVIVAPSHREYFDGISVFPGTGYATPLGVASVDGRLRDVLLQRSPYITGSNAGHGDEHAIEVELPFLQSVLHAFMILPIVMGDQRREYCFALGTVLAEVMDDDMLLIASTDLSHYHPASLAEEIDRVTIADVEGFDHMQLMADLETRTAEACGGGPMVALMAAFRARGSHDMHILHHCHSGDITGERESVVGYLAAVVSHQERS